MKPSLSKQVIGTLLIASQLTGMAFADVQTAAQNDDSQEVQLIASLVGLAGTKMSPKDYQAQTQAAVSAYETSSTVDEGRSDRLTQAMIDLNLMQPGQAENVKASIDASVGAALAANPNMSESDRNQLVTNATAQEMNHSFSGAQFSGCAGMGIGAGAVLAASILANVYASTLTTTSTSKSSTGTSTGTGSTTAGNSGSSSSTTTTSNSGSSTTTTSSNTPNETEKKLLITGAIIGYGVSATMIIYMLVSNSNGTGVCGDDY